MYTTMPLENFSISDIKKAWLFSKKKYHFMEYGLQKLFLPQIDTEYESVLIELGIPYRLTADGTITLQVPPGKEGLFIGCDGWQIKKWCTELGVRRINVVSLNNGIKEEKTECYN